MVTKRYKILPDNALPIDNRILFKQFFTIHKYSRKLLTVMKQISSKLTILLIGILSISLITTGLTNNVYSIKENYISNLWINYPFPIKQQLVNQKMI